MKLTTLRSLAILASSPLTVAIHEIRNPEKQAKYTSGAVMGDIMVNKYVSLFCVAVGLPRLNDPTDR